MKNGKEDSRDRIIVRTSVIGIAANVFLAVFKAIIGILSNSIAVVLDAVNNISDAASSVITIIGTKLAGKLPNKKHPFGHGRTEYLTAVIISVIILYAGFTSLVESVKKIITPETPDYSVTALVIIAVAVGIYAYNTKDPEAAEIEKKFREIALSHEHVIQIHGFYFMKEEKQIRGDIMVSFDAKDRMQVFREVVAEEQKAFPDYQIHCILDTDFAET